MGKAHKMSGWKAELAYMNAGKKQMRFIYSSIGEPTFHAVVKTFGDGGNMVSVKFWYGSIEQIVKHWNMSPVNARATLWNASNFQLLRALRSAQSAEHGRMRCSNNEDDRVLVGSRSPETGAWVFKEGTQPWDTTDKEFTADGSHIEGYQSEHLDVPTPSRGGSASSLR